MKSHNHSIVHIVLAVCTSLLSIQASAQTQITTVSAINIYTSGIDKFIKANPKARIFADVSSDINDAESVWREFKSEAERQKAETGENMNRSALVWTRKGNVIGADFTFTSPTGDWAHLIMYYFRDDGTLAKIQAQLNTFYGDISVVRVQYFAANGKLLKATRKYLDLQTQKPKKPGEFMDNPVPVYRKVTALPFHKLL